MTLDRWDRWTPYGRVGSTVNAIGGAALSTFGFVNGWILWAIGAAVLDGVFIYVCVRAWRGDYDNLHSWDVMKNPFQPARPRIPGAGIRSGTSDGDD